MKTWLLFSAALVLESLALIQLGIERPADVRLLAFVSAHALAAACAVVAVMARLPRSRRHWGVGILLAALVVFVPVMGVLCLALGVAAAHRMRHQPACEDWCHTKIPDLPSQPVQVSDRPLYSRGGVIEALRHASDPEPRMHAVMAARQLPDRHAIPVLRLALRDISDDVRLFAYSALDRKETAINSAIHGLQRRLDAGEDGPRIHARLAQHMWDLAYLGLAQGEVRRHVLATAKRHAHAGAEGMQAAAMCFLLGRIALDEGCLEEAVEQLDAAEAQGIDKAEMAPFRAEIAYRQGAYGQVRAQLRQLPPVQRGDSALTEVVDYWLRA